MLLKIEYVSKAINEVVIMLIHKNIKKKLFV